jgi:hypothetical protein
MSRTVAPRPFVSPKRGVELITDLEGIVLDLLLAGDDPSLAVLRRQLSHTEVVEREFTGVGFFTRLRVPPAAPVLEQRPRLVIGDVYGKIAHLEHEAGFLLFVTDGVLDRLECFIVDKAWPSNASLERAFYMRPDAPGSSRLIETKTRDLEWALRRDGG